MSKESNNLNNSDNSKKEEKSKNTIPTNQKEIKLSQYEINDLIKKNQSYSDEIKNLKSEIVSLKDKINEQLVIITNNKLNYDKETKGMKEKYEQEIKQLKSKLDNSSSNLKVLENTYKIKINEIEKDKELLSMKNKNLENQINEFNNKISQLNKEYDSQFLIMKENKKRTISDYEKQIEELKTKLENIQLKSIDTETKLKTQEQLVAFAKFDQDEIKIKYENEIKELTSKLDNLQKKAENDKKRMGAQLEMKENIIQKLFNQQKELENEMENKIKENEEKIMQKSNETQKIYYQEKQQKEFLEEKCKDLEEQIESLKQNQIQLVSAFEENGRRGIESGGADGAMYDSSLAKRVEKIQNLFNQEKANLENDFKKEKEYYLKDQADKVESITQLKEQNKNLDMENEAKQKKIEDLTSELDECKKKLELTQEIRSHFNDELGKKTKNIVEDYELQLTKKEEEHRNEIRILNEQNEKTLNQLKKIFNDEKVRLDEKINTQKKKFDDKMNNIINEYETKIKEQEEQCKLEVDNIQYAYEELEGKYNALSLDSQHQIELLSEKLLTTDNFLNEDKERLLKLTNVHNKEIEKKLNEFNKERKELNEKVESLNIEKTKLAQEINKKNEIISQLKATIQEKDKEIEDSKKEYDTAMDRFINKFEQYKQKQQDSINEYNIKKLEYLRENKLLKQQIDYLNKHMLFYEENDKSHEDNIIELKNELEESFSNKIIEIMNEKKELSDKLKESREQINLLNEKNKELSKIFEEKYNNQQQECQKIINDYEKQIKKLIEEREILVNQSTEPIIKINQLLEEKSEIQAENYQFKEKIQYYENLINNMEKENQNLVKEKENLISNMNHIDSRIKSKGAKNIDISKKIQNLGQSSVDMIRKDFDLEKDYKRKKNQTLTAESNSNEFIIGGHKYNALNRNTEKGKKPKISIAINNDEKKKK